MCGIFGSFDVEMFNHLHEINRYRGERSYSLFYCYDSQDTCLIQEHGIMPTLPLKSEYRSPYILGHIQAPTSAESNIHPAKVDDYLLWHNGIIKQTKCTGWDTKWMLQQIVKDGLSALSTFDGSFACILFMKGELYCFRNEISPLFIDTYLNISSTKFDSSEELPPNVVWKMDLRTKSLIQSFQFNTKENPYFFL